MANSRSKWLMLPTLCRPSSLVQIVQEEEEGIGDMDLFTLTSDKHKLTVTSKWFQYLQVSIESKSVQAVHA